MIDAFAWIGTGDDHLMVQLYIYAYLAAIALAIAAIAYSVWWLINTKLLKKKAHFWRDTLIILGVVIGGFIILYTIFYTIPDTARKHKNEVCNQEAGIVGDIITTTPESMATYDQCMNR